MWDQTEYCECISEKEVNVRFTGRMYRDGKFWLIEIPILNVMTQGYTRKEAFEMIADLVETLADKHGFSVTVHPGKSGAFEVSSSDTRTMVSLLLQRQRELSGLSLAQAAKRLGVRSRNAYARYEQGVSVPTVEKLNELLHAVAPNKDFVLTESQVNTNV